MYYNINTLNDILKEKYIQGSELTELRFPKIVPIRADLDNLRPVSFQDAAKEKRPKECVAHFFTDDYRFERIWNNCEKYIDILRNFKYICSPDFSCYSEMPYIMQLWQIYRNRAISHFLTAMGLDVIPTVVWSDSSSFDFCFQGLPQESTLAVSTNGCFSKNGKECYRNGFKEMCHRLYPYNILVIGQEIKVNVDVDIIYMKSFGQYMTKRLGGGLDNGKPKRGKECQEKDGI